MRHWIWHRLAGLLFGLALSGCANRTCYQTDRRPSVSPNATAATAPVPASEKGGLEWSSLPSLDRVNEVLPGETAASGYREIGADESQCSAAVNSALGNMLAAEYTLICSSRVDQHGMLSPADALMADLFAARAIEERNKAAGIALELFYRLAEAPIQRDLLRRSVQEVEHSIANYRQLREQGIAMPSDDTALQRQRLELLDRQVQLETSSHRAEGQLGRLLAMPSDPQAPLKPVANFTVSVVPVDIEAAVRDGLTMRPDLAMVQMLYDRLNDDTLPTIRSGMQLMGGLLGAAAPLERRRLKGIASAQLADERATRQTQLCMALTDQTRAVEEEIRQASREIESQLRQAALAKQEWDSWLQHIRGLQEKHGVAKATEFEISKARLLCLQAESDAVRALVAWKIAQVKLTQAQGLLAYQCGCRLPGR